jgi:hypothetical protein
MVAVADTKDGIAAVCNLAKRPRSIYLLYYLPPKNCGCRPKGGGGYGARAPPLNTLLHTALRRFEVDRQYYLRWNGEEHAIGKIHCWKHVKMKLLAFDWQCFNFVCIVNEFYGWFTVESNGISLYQMTFAGFVNFLCYTAAHKQLILSDNNQMAFIMLISRQQA